MTTSAHVLFLASAFLALAGAFGTVISEKPLRAAMSLLLTVMSMAGLYLSLHAELLASIQMLVYAGAVVVLFVFVIMLIGPEGASSRPSARVTVPIATAALLTTFFASMAAHIGRGVPERLPTAPAGFGSVEGVGRALYVDAVVPFESISITLLVAILAAIAVARGRTASEAEAVRRDREKRASLPPDPEGADA